MVRQAIIIVLLFLFSHSYAAEINYYKSTTIPPLRVSFADLQRILDKAASLMATANSKEGSKLRREEVSLYKGGHRITLSGHVLIAERARLPQTIDRLEYAASTDDPAPVSRIQMSFSDFSRELKVEGLSPDQVDAVFSSLKDDLVDISSVVGGPLTQLFFFPFLFFMGVIYVFSTLFDWIKLKKRPLLAPLGFTVLGLILLWSLPIGQMFAGFSAIQGDSSFMVRYGPQISFLGLVLSLVGILISYWFSRTKSGGPR